MSVILQPTFWIHPGKQHQLLAGCGAPLEPLSLVERLGSFQPLAHSVALSSRSGKEFGFEPSTPQLPAGDWQWLVWEGKQGLSTPSPSGAPAYVSLTARGLLLQFSLGARNRLVQGVGNGVETFLLLAPIWPRGGGG